MEDFNKFEKLKVWRLSHQLVLNIYKDTEVFPRSEVQSLTKQLRRSAASVPANIAEGTGTNTDLNFCRYLYIARGSLMETRYHMRLAKDLGYLSLEKFKEYEKAYHQVGSMLNALINSLGINKINS